MKPSTAVGVEEVPVRHQDRRTRLFPGGTRAIDVPRHIESGQALEDDILHGIPGVTPKRTENRVEGRARRWRQEARTPQDAFPDAAGARLPFLARGESAGEVLQLVAPGVLAQIVAAAELRLVDRRGGPRLPGCGHTAQGDRETGQHHHESRGGDPVADPDETAFHPQYYGASIGNKATWACSTALFPVYTGGVECRSYVPLPYAILGLLLAVWIGLGVWICGAAPYASGTDESIRYVAFAAAKNRWASAEDAAAFKIEHYYYPPLYFLLFAPFYGDNPSFGDRYPPWSANVAMRWSGSTRLASSEDLRQVPPELWRLYRTAKATSLLFGVGIVICLIASLRVVFTGENRDWLTLGTTGPLLLLPQFLYYQTLVNNDCLVNFLCALALYCFIAAARRVADGDAAGAWRFSVGCAAAVGLGLLTKPSAAALLPLLPALAWLQTGARATSPPRARFVTALRHLAILGAVTTVAGGWWLLRSYLSADPGGLLAAKAAHGWAFRQTGTPEDLLTIVITGVARSSIALFAGGYYGIPDLVYTIYLAVAAGLAIAGTPAVLSRLFRGHRVAKSTAIPALASGMLVVSVVSNLALLVKFNQQVIAPHGRLLFPTLIAAGIVFARALLAISGGSRRRLAPLVCALLVGLGGLFAWTFVNRMVPAVTQPEENLVPLGVIPDGKAADFGPIWGGTVQQPVLLPRGHLTGFRLPIERNSFLPQFGTVLHASLRRLPATPGDPGRTFRPFPLGENDNSARWTEIELETPLDLPGLTPALLELRAEKPWLVAPGTDIYYKSIELDRSPQLKPLSVDGKPMTFGLALTAVYH